ncbi:TPA: pyruvate, phosphate dikinase [Candidatus Avacholeplasma faecigallinarum]|nr:pyruvate, phosphate dikinase [Candidatus Avacholeplasma faecigallinarum]
MMKKWVYLFEEGNASMRELLGGKGANLAEMTNLGLPIPHGFTITTQACMDYFSNGEKINAEIIDQIEKALKVLQNQQNKIFGDVANPLLVSVRSGARASMPGMMDTILNLGLNDESVKGLAQRTNNERFAYDSYRRFIQMFSDVVMGLSKSKFEDVLQSIKKSKGYVYDYELQVEDLKYVVSEYKKFYKENLKSDFPQNPKDQLFLAIEAVFKSWNNPRAIYYRKLNDIPADWGTAVNIQAMVFGNMGQTSGTGVAFTRNPATGEKQIYGEYLINAQGEDVVAGIRTPSPIIKLKEDLENVYNEFIKIADILENHYHDMQDMEFTIENGKLYFLQTRNGKRTAQAAIEIACQMVEEGLISKEEAVLRIEPKSLDQLLHPKFSNEALKNATVIAKGLPASPGAACGRVYFNAEDAKNAHKRKEKVILVRMETSPEDIEGMHIAEGTLTAHGGMTSHAAVVARGMGAACVSGCKEVEVDEENKVMHIGQYTIAEGDYICIDGSTGCVYLGQIKTIPATITGNLEKIMTWADGFRTLKIRTNADTINDAKTAVMFGAEGIGLCRSEHMFFNENRIPEIRKMILARNVEERKVALDKLLVFQKEDYKGLFEVLEGKNVTIRLIDPPLHEFLPKGDDIKELANQMHRDYEEVLAQCESLHEFNPMMGHRGCRLCVTFPEIAQMQARAIMEAAIEVIKEKGYNIVPEIMVPLVDEVKELKFVKNIIVDEINKVFKEKNIVIKYHIGTMIETPRAALLADEIATEAEFFSFGTNDLTQMTFGLSRDDASKFLGAYYENGIYENDPFAKLDQKGVGKLIANAVKLGKQTRNDIHLGICGEHGGEPSSIEFVNKLGLDYVSCSPYRVPIARLAAAQAAIKLKK